MAEIPEPEHTTYNAIKEARKTSGIGRPYLGMSETGGKCFRKLQYNFRNAYVKETSARMNRLFDFGGLAEDLIIRDLKAAGIKVYDQQMEIVGFAGHVMGHIDGKCIGVIEAPKTEHLIEFKTHNDKSFKELQKNGVEQSKPGHYCQMQRYMHGLGLTRALYVGYNKNDSELYFERVKYEKEFALDLVRREQEILFEEYLQPRIGNGRPNWYECTYCDAKDVCFDLKPVNKICRTCNHVDIADKGRWLCGLNNDKELSWEDQQKACEMWTLAELFKR